MTTIPNLTSRTALSLTRSAFASLGIDLPQDLIKDLGHIETTLAAGAGLRFNIRELAEATAAALEAGKDPATDKTVLTLLARRQLADDGMSRQIAALAEDRRRDTMRTHAPSLVEAMRPIVERADLALTTAREAIGPDLDLTDRNGVLRLPAAKMSIWGEAQEAVEKMTKVAQAWVMVASISGVPQNRAQHPLILATLTASELAALGQNPRATAAMHAGHRLDLATLEGYLERVAAVDQETVAVPA